MRSIDRTDATQLVPAILAELGGALHELRCGMTERMIHLGVSMTQLHVLWLLEHHGEVPMSRLAELLDVSVSNSTGLIDRMEERGLVERARVRDDRRLVKVRLGPEGLRVLRELEDSRLDRVQRALAPLDPERLCGVLQAFTDFRSAIQADLGPHDHSHLATRATNPDHPSVPAAPLAQPDATAP